MTNRNIATRNRRILLLCASALASATFSYRAAAQDNDADSSESEGVIIVTGTSLARTAQDTPVAITNIDKDAIARLTASGQADILNSIPTIKADGGGGEVAANVFVKGLPSGGQYQFTPLMYDGVPVMSTFGLNSSAFDVYYRNDLAIDRLEFVRGGASNLFGPGSVAGLINYITRDGTDETHGSVQLEVAEGDRYRGDAAISGPLGENLFYSVSGFYRSDKGPYRTNLDTEGFQVRGNLKMEFSDGSGFVKLQGQYIDDEVVFYLPVPLDGETRKRASGNDGERVNSVFNDFSANLGFNTPDGPFVSDINDGVATEGGQVALIFEKDFGAGWGINGRLKYSDYDHKFGLWLDGDGVINVPETLQSFLTNRGLGNLADADFTFSDGSGAVPADFLLFANRFVDRDRPMEDFSAEFNLTKEFSTGSAEHTLTLGSFYADTKAGDVNVTTT